MQGGEEKALDDSGKPLVKHWKVSTLELNLEGWKWEPRMENEPGQTGRWYLLLPSSLSSLPFPCWLVFIDNLIQARVIQKEQMLIEKAPPLDWTVGAITLGCGVTLGPRCC